MWAMERRYVAPPLLVRRRRGRLCTAPSIGATCIHTHITCLEIRKTGPLAPNGSKKDKPRGPAKNLEKALVKQLFVQERGGQIKNKSYG